MIYYPKILFDLEESRMALPGYLNDVAPQHAIQWNGIVEEMLDRAVRDISKNQTENYSNPSLKVVADGRCHLSGRSVLCDGGDGPRKGASRRDKLLHGNPIERVRGQQALRDFIEWRDVRDADGRLLRVEMTTETHEYWAFLASVDPSQTLQLLADFARVQSIDPSDVYGALDPFSATSTPEQRRAAFLSQMVPRVQGQSVHSTYNNGKRALAFMSGDTNSLSAAINACASRNLGTGAMSPTDPAGIYIKQAGKRGDLLLPDKTTPIPRRWMTLSRGTSITRNGVHNSFYQRLVVEPDPESGLALGDVIVAQTGSPVTSGADIARLVTTTLYLTSTQPSLGTTSERLRSAEPKTGRPALSIPLG